MKVLVVEPLAGEGIALLRAHHEVDERIGLSRDELCAIVGDYDALVVRSQVQADAALIAAGPRLLVIGRAGVGVDNVDLDAATRAGIVVVNAPTGNTIAAAEHTLALMYGLARRIAAGDSAMRAGDWKAARGRLTGVELRGRTLGIVGLGKIGQAIADRARAMEMTILGQDPFVTAEQAALHGIELVEIGELLRKSDVVTVHVPLTRQTRGMIGKRELGWMKPTALLLNVARGGIIDEQALADALAAGTVAGAAIDVFEHEPPFEPNPRSPLLDAPNTLLTPHLGASTAEAQVRVAEEVAAQIVDVLDGRPARYAVNAPLLTPETAAAIAPYLPLAETLGRFFAQFARRGVKTLTLDVAGSWPGTTPRHSPRPCCGASWRLSRRAGQPRQRRRAREGARDRDRRTQDARGGRVRLAADAVGRGTGNDDDRRRHGGGRRTAVHPPQRLPARHGPDAVHARQPPHGPAGVGRPDRADPRRGGRQHQRDASRPVWTAPGRADHPRPRRRSARPDRRGDPVERRGRRALVDPARRRPLSEHGGLTLPADLSAVVVLLRHGESTLIVEGRFQGAGRRAALAARRAPGSAGRRAAGRPRPIPRPADPADGGARDRPLTAEPGGVDGRGGQGGHRRARRIRAGAAPAWPQRDRPGALGGRPPDRD